MILRWRWLFLSLLLLAFCALGVAAKPVYAATPVLVAQPNKTVANGDGYYSAPVTLKGNTYMWLITAAYGRELWRTDGTNAGTKLLRDLFPGRTDGIMSD